MNFGRRNSIHNITLPVPLILPCLCQCRSICLQFFVTNPLISISRLGHLNLVHLLLPVFLHSLYFFFNEWMLFICFHVCFPTCLVSLPVGRESNLPFCSQHLMQFLAHSRIIKCLRKTELEMMSQRK